ncbi:MAG: hypothetical protein RL481_1647 [Pseudomonadota bacterium]
MLTRNGKIQPKTGLTAASIWESEFSRAVEAVFVSCRDIRLTRSYLFAPQQRSASLFDHATIGNRAFGSRRNRIAENPADMGDILGGSCARAFGLSLSRRNLDRQ